MPMASNDAWMRLSTFFTNKLNVLPSTATKISAAALSFAKKKSHKNKYSLHELSNRANCSLRNMLSREYFNSDFSDACGIMIDASISFSIIANLFPRVKTVLLLRIVGLEEKSDVFGLSSEPNKSSLSATSSNCNLLSLDEYSLK